MKKNNFNQFVNELALVMECDVSELEASRILSNYSTWDSLAMVSVIALIDQYFQIKISSDDIEKCKTMKDVFLLTIRN